MKNLFRIFLSTIICFCVVDNTAEFNAKAAEIVTMSGIEISISSDKSEYSVGEDANINFIIKNNNESDLNNLNWKLVVPDDLKLKNGDLSGQNIKISAGDTLEGSVVVAKATALTTQASTTSATTTTTVTTTAKNNVQSDSANTGDYRNIMLPLTIIAISILIAFLSRKKSKKVSKLFSLLLCLTFISSLKPAMAFSIKNDEISANVDKTIKIDNSQYKIELSVSCDNELAVSDELYAWAEINQKENIISLNWLEQSDSVAYRVYNQTDEKPIAEVKGSTKYDFAISESDKKNEYVFCIETENTNGKKNISNYVVVKRNDKGSYSFIDIDSDNDGLSDLKEINLKTNRLVSDTDNDGLLDGYEYSTSQTDPLLLDTDEDGILDGTEDYEGDGLTNIQEYKYKSNPYACDTDDDGFPDGYEIENGMDPLSFDEIKIDNSIASQIKDYTEYDLEILNANEEYPLEVYYNDEGNVERVNGLYSSDKIKSAQDALYSLYNIKSLLGFEDPSSELKLDKTVFSSAMSTYSFNQVYNDVEIEGRNITVTCNKDGKIISIYSSYLEPSMFNEIKTVPLIKENELKSLIDNETGKYVNVFSSQLLIDIEDKPVLIYRVITSSNDEYKINAHTGDVISSDKLWSLREFEGGTISATDENGDNQDFDPDTYFYDEDNCIGYMYDESKNMYICDWSDQLITIGEKVNNGEYPEITDTIQYNDNGCQWDDEAVSAYVNLRFAYNRYKQYNDYTGLDGKGGRTILFTHGSAAGANGGQIVNNAFYTFFPYDYIMIIDPDRGASEAANRWTVCHEYGHGIFHNRSHSHSSRFMRTVNEAYADIFSSWANAEWMAESYPSRNITDPHSSSNPIRINDSTMVSVNSSGGTTLVPAYDTTFNDVHRNSTIISYPAYLLNTQYGYSLSEIYALFYESLPSLSDSYTEFGQVEATLISTARGLGYSNDKIEGIYRAFNAVGVELPKGSARLLIKEGNDPIHNTCITITNYSDSKTRFTDSDGRAVFDDLKVGTYKVKIWVPDREPIYTSMLIRENELSEKIINLLTASTNYDWDEYDHHDYEQQYGPTLSKHIDINESDIKMTGYTEAPFKDFLLTHENDISDSFVHWPRKILSFNLDKDDVTDTQSAYWHTLEGGGFLFDVSITDQDEENEGKLTAHCILVTPFGLKIYDLYDVDISKFRHGILGSIAYVGSICGETSYDIGDVTAEHSISIDIQKGTNEKISVWDNGQLIIDNLEIDRLDGDDYGPIISHVQHGCSQVSWFTFSDIQISNVF